MDGTAGLSAGEVEPSLASAAQIVRPFERAGLVSRVRPFGLVALAGLFAVAVSPAPVDPFAFGLGICLAASAFALALGLPWSRAPGSLDLVPPLLFVMAVAAMRQAGGGQSSWLVTLFAVPLVWVALYGTRRQVLITLVVSAIALVLPIMTIGSPEYPDTEWPRAVVNLAVGALVSVTVHDLVARIGLHVRAEAARAAQLAGQEERLRAIHETAHDAIVTLTPEGTIVDVNPAALQMFRATDPNDLVGVDLISTLAPDEVREYLRTGMARLTVARDETTSRQFQTELLRLDGEAFPVDVTVGVVQDHGRYLVHTFARDISERVRAEEAASRQLEDLQRLLEVGRQLSSPTATAALRPRICEAALGMTGASMVTLYEPDGDDLVLTASAGRQPPVDRVSRTSRTSAAAEAFRTGEAYYSSHLADDPRVATTLAINAGVNSGYWQPINGSDGVAGVLIVFWDEQIAALDRRTESLLHLLASQASAALEMGRLVTRLEDLARTDGLTGIANRRTFDEALAREVARAGRSPVPLSLVMLDLDNFKAYNDARGHQAGDRLLIEAAGAWARELRTADLLCRYGGEEFAVILPDCPLPPAVRVAERLRRVTPGGQTTSAGVATWQDGESPADLLARADAALYRAKGEGRNRSIAA